MDTPLNFLENIQQYIFENLLSVLWTASLLVGGFIFWLYFSEIQYFPDLDFDESVLFLVVAAITGIFFLLFIAFLFISPYFFRWIFWEQQNREERNEEKSSNKEPAWYFFSIFIAHSALVLYFILDFKFKDPWLSFGVPGVILVLIYGHWKFYLKPLFKKDSNFKLLRAWIASAFFSLFPLFLGLFLVEKIGLENQLLLFMAALLLIFPYFFRCWLILREQPSLPPSREVGNEEKSSNTEPAWYFISIITAQLSLFLYFFLDLKLKDPWLSFGVPGVILLVLIYGQWQIYLKPLFKKDSNFQFLGAWITSAFFSLFPLFLVLFLVEKIGLESDLDQIYVFIALLAIVMCSNIIFAYYNEKKTKPWWLWSIPFLTVFLVLYIAREPLIPKLVMNKFKFGHYTAQRLLVDKEGCKILKSLELIPSSAKDQKTCYLKNIKILSRLGRSFYIETTETTHQCKPLRFTIPSKHVISWSVPVPDK